MLFVSLHCSFFFFLSVGVSRWEGWCLCDCWNCFVIHSSNSIVWFRFFVIFFFRVVFFSSHFGIICFFFCSFHATFFHDLTAWNVFSFQSPHRWRSPVDEPPERRLMTTTPPASAASTSKATTALAANWPASWLALGRATRSILQGHILSMRECLEKESHIVSIGRVSTWRKKYMSYLSLINVLFVRQNVW